MTIDLEVPGLIIEHDFISQAHETALIEILRNLAWPERNGRLALHYGHTFSYKTMGIDHDVPYIPFPDWLVATLPANEARVPEQVCVQFYKPGTGIPPHVDTHSIYNQLYALSIGAPVIMDFKRDEMKVEIDLEPRSMLQMTRDSRLHWTHGIKKRKRDVIRGQGRLREDRWSITYRWLRDGECECGDIGLCDTAQRRLGIEKKFRWQDDTKEG